MSSRWIISLPNLNHCFDVGIYCDSVSHLLKAQLWQVQILQSIVMNSKNIKSRYGKGILRLKNISGWWPPASKMLGMNMKLNKSFWIVISETDLNPHTPKIICFIERGNRMGTRLYVSCLCKFFLFNSDPEFSLLITCCNIIAWNEKIYFTHFIV